MYPLSLPTTPRRSEPCSRTSASGSSGLRPWLRVSDGALSSARATGFASYGESLSLCPRKEKVTKEKARPDIRVCSRSEQTSLAPAPLRGPACKGHPWPFKPLAASLRLVPLRNTSTQPTDGGMAPRRRMDPGASAEIAIESPINRNETYDDSAYCAGLSPSRLRPARARFPVRRPSAVGVQ